MTEGIFRFTDHEGEEIVAVDFRDGAPVISVGEPSVELTPTALDELIKFLQGCQLVG